MKNDIVHEVAQADRVIRGALADLHNQICKACRDLTSVGEPCEQHAPPYDALNSLRSNIDLLRMIEIEQRQELETIKETLERTARIAELESQISEAWKQEALALRAKI